MASARELILTILHRSTPVLILAVLVVLAVHGVRQIPPQHAPWAELSLRHPVGMATHRKLRGLMSDQTACSAALATAPALQTRPAAPDAGTEACPLTNAVAFEQSSVSYGGGFAASCSLAAALYVWEREMLQPAAQDYLGSSIERIDQIGSFACRNIYNRSGGRLSEHASANALDITGFRLANGEGVSVLRDWGQATANGRFLDALIERSCPVFSGVMTPAYNRATATIFISIWAPIGSARRGRSGKKRTPNDRSQTDLSSVVSPQTRFQREISAPSVLRLDRTLQIRGLA